MPYLIANKEQTSAEEFDQEVVVIHFLRGTYFSLRGAAVALWHWLEHGADEPTLVALLCERYSLEQATAQAEVKKCLDQFSEHELVLIDEAGSAPAKANHDVGAGLDDFASAEVELFDDLQELIAIDPVHEVDPMQGWPHRPPKVELD